jgi:hypothetical protein
VNRMAARPLDEWPKASKRNVAPNSVSGTEGIQFLDRHVKAPL